MELSFQIIPHSDLTPALSLILDTFHRYEAPDYAQEGILEFENAIKNPSYLENHVFWGAHQEDMLLGVIALRDGYSHIALFFVKEGYLGQGIGTALFRHVLPMRTKEYITVNSSPFAVPVYRRLGFTETASEQVVNGIRFTPMIYGYRS